MRVATFNLESLDLPPRAGLPIEERIRALRPQLERLAADVLCLQEVNGQKPETGGGRELLALDALIADMPYRDFHRAETRRTGDKGAFDVHNLTILSRYPIRGFQQFWHDLVPAAEVQCTTGDPAAERTEPVRFGRPLLFASVELPDGATLHIVNLHLRAPLAVPIPGGKSAPLIWQRTQRWAEGYYLAEIMRAGQALEARLVVDRLFDDEADALVLVCGDLNCEAFETPVRILQASEEDTGNGGLAARSLVLAERSLPRDRRFSVLHHGRPQMLDHILMSRALFGRFEHMEVHNEMLEDELVAFGQTRRSAASFHAPVVASFAETAAKPTAQ